jgi:3',5'-cyclic AMP phosphodiesterase CpdA
VVNYQARLVCKPRKEIVRAEQIAAMLQDMLKDRSWRYKEVVRKPTVDSEPMALVMDLFDLHIGMLAWGEETLSEDWNSKIGTAMAIKAVDSLINRLSGLNISQIIFPMGNDLLHTDQTIGGKGGATTGGTPQDVDSRYLKMYRAATELMVTILDRLREIAPVLVVVVPGNHDMERAAYLGETINAWYRNDPEITVNNSASLRKYETFGNTLLGFTHGQGEKPEELPLIMASEEPVRWGQTKYRVFHTGHFHRKRKMLSVTTDTYNGVEVLTLPSLVPPDSWHAMKGYVGGGRAAEAYLVGMTSGPCGYFRFNV